MNKDTEVISFRIAKNDRGGLDTADLRVLREDLVPYGFGEGILSFVRGRKGTSDFRSYIKVSNAASLTDTFWIRDELHRKAWKDVSLYRRDFGTEDADMTLTGDYPKRWVRLNGNLYLIKRGSEIHGREVFAEFYASQIAEEICLHPVTYTLTDQSGYLSTSCEIFTSEDMGFSQMTYHVEDTKNITPAEALVVIEKYGDGDDFRRMMVLDALTLNIDRHLGNFGLLIDNDTLKPLGMAPEFDNNRSMLYNFSDERFARTDMNRLLDIDPRFEGGEFNLIANDMLTPAIKSDLKNLSGFHFKRHDTYNWSEARLTKFEDFVHRQIDKILNRTVLYMN